MGSANNCRKGAVLTIAELKDAFIASAIAAGILKVVMEVLL